MIDRSPYYRGLNIPQIEALANLDEQNFQNWINRGASTRAIDVLLEEKNARAHKGQVPPNSAAGLTNPKGRVGDDGLVLAPTDRLPTQKELDSLNQDWERFTFNYPQFIPSKSNAKILLKYLSSRGGSSCYANLVKAFEAMFGQFSLRIVEKGVQTSETRLTNKRGERVQMDPVLYPKSVKSQLFETIFSPAQVRALSGNDVERMMKPMQFPREWNADRIENMSADAFYKEFLDNEDDHLPDAIVARIEQAIGEFKNACPDYDASDPSNRAILELYFDNYKKQYGTELPRDVATSYMNAWRFYKENKVVPVAPTDEIVVNGRKLGKQNPEIHGVDPTFDLNPQLRRRLRAMSSTEFYEWCAQNPELKKQIDEGGL